MVRGRTEKLGDILRNVMARRSLATGYQRRRIQSDLASLLSPEELRHIAVGNINKGCLTVLVDSATVLYELHAFRVQEILAGLKAAGHEGIRKVRFEFEEKTP